MKCSCIGFYFTKISLSTWQTGLRAPTLPSAFYFSKTQQLFLYKYTKQKLLFLTCGWFLLYSANFHSKSSGGLKQGVQAKPEKPFFVGKLLEHKILRIVGVLSSVCIRQKLELVKLVMRWAVTIKESFPFILLQRDNGRDNKNRANKI